MGAWNQDVHQEDYSDASPKWNKSEQEANWGIKPEEETKNDPVSQPSSIVICLLGLEGLERLVSRVQEQEDDLEQDSWVFKQENREGSDNEDSEHHQDWRSVCLHSRGLDPLCICELSESKFVGEVFYVLHQIEIAKMIPKTKKR